MCGDGEVVSGGRGASDRASVGWSTGGSSVDGVSQRDRPGSRDLSTPERVDVRLGQ